MQYLTIIDNTPYHHWQVELLIESFRAQNEEDQLFIGIANPEKPTIEQFTQNLLSHPNKFYFSDYENKPELNRIFGTILAVKEKIVEQPFVLIDADTLLARPFESDRKEHVVFHTASEDESFKNRLRKYIEQSLKDNQIDQESLKWIPIGDTIFFNGIPERFFFRALEWGNRLLKEEGPGWDIDAASWIMAAFDFIRIETFHNDFLEVTMLHHNVDAPFIHYEHGLPPDFIKKNFSYDGELSFFSAGSPFDAILKNNPTSSTDYMQKIVRSYLEGEARRHQDQVTVTAN